MNKLLFYLSLFLFLSCSDKKRENLKFTEEQIQQLRLHKVEPLKIIENEPIILDLNKFLQEKEIFVDDFVENVTYIPLETTKESLIAEVNKLVSTEDYFFVLDSDIGGNVFIFFKNGKFIKKIPVGQGPKDIYRPADIAVDESLGHLIVYNRKGFSFYDYQGNFIKRELVPFNFNNFRVIPEGYIFTMDPNRNNHMENVSDMQFLITDKKFRIISAGLPFHYSTSNHYNITDNTDAFNQNIYYAPKLSEEIYQYLDTISLKIKFRLDFSGKNIPNSYKEMSGEQFFDILKENNYWYFMGDFKENQTYQYISINNNYNKKTYKTFIFRNKENGVLIGGNKIKLSERVPIFSYPLTAHKNNFIGVVSSNIVHNYVLWTNEENKKSLVNKKVNPDDNPFIIKYNLKDVTFAAQR